MKKINIRESLLNMDRDTDCRYDLTTLYEACNLDEKKKSKLIQYIDSYDIEGTNKFLTNEASNVGLMENTSDDLDDVDCEDCSESFIFEDIGDNYTLDDIVESYNENYDKERSSEIIAEAEEFINNLDKSKSVHEDLQKDLERRYTISDAHTSNSVLRNVEELAASESVKEINPVVKYDTQMFEMISADGRVFYLIPVTMSQFDVYDADENLITKSEFAKYIVDEVLSDKSNLEFVYEIVGGDCAGKYSREELEALPCFSGKYTDDQSEIRANGGFTSREELDNQPILNGYVGPMMDGWENHKMRIRYETQEVYDRLSEDTNLDEASIGDKLKRAGNIAKGLAQGVKNSFKKKEDGTHPITNVLKQAAAQGKKDLKYALDSSKDTFNKHIIDTALSGKQPSVNPDNQRVTVNGKSVLARDVKYVKKDKDGKQVIINNSRYNNLTPQEKAKYSPALQEDIFDDFDEPGVRAGKDFDAEGREYAWMKRHGDVAHLDFDNWAVWEVFCHDDAEIYYMVVDEDTEFIVWGPCDTLEEAQEFLQSKVDDYNNDDLDEAKNGDTWEIEYNNGAVERQQMPNKTETINGDWKDVVKELDAMHVDLPYEYDEQDNTLPLSLEQFVSKYEDNMDVSGSTVVLKITKNGEVVFKLSDYENYMSDDLEESINLNEAAETYKGYFIVRDPAGDGWNVFNSDKEIEEEGCATLADAKKLINTLAETLNETTLSDIEKVDDKVELDNGEVIVHAGDGTLYKGTEDNLELVDENDDDTYNKYIITAKVDGIKVYYNDSANNFSVDSNHATKYSEKEIAEDDIDAIGRDRFYGTLAVEEVKEVKESYSEDEWDDDELASIYGGDTKQEMPDGVETPEETEARLAKEANN